MSVAVDSGDVERFRATIARQLGLHFDESRLAFLADLLGRRAEHDGKGCEAYLSRIETTLPRTELTALVQELTVPETYFFRNIDQFRAFAEVVLPERLRVRGSARRMQMLSAGCASGEEAYSLAMLARELVPGPSWEVSIVGVDVNPAALDRAARAQYSTWAMRETPPETQRRWFHPRGNERALDDSLRGAVRFEERNLAQDNPELWSRETYDVVFCRNVIMYFTPEAAQALVARIASALAPGGFLFLGHAETLRGLSQDFHLRHTHGTFYYQRKEAQGTSAQPASATPQVSAIIDDAETWVEAIQKASERIHALAHVSQASAPAGLAAGPRSPRWDLALAMELLRKERYGEALEAIQALPPESVSDPDVLLIRAVLLAQGGELARAEEVSRRLLEIDELNAGAHYVLALCREGAGDRSGAVEQDQVAIYLDSSFAMPRLHLGLLARRTGDRDSAKREFGQALTLLRREEPARLLLFGGGFDREALLALCRSELLACGGQP